MLNARFVLLPLVLACAGYPARAEKILRAGVCSVDLSPRTFPIIISGGFLAKEVNEASGSLRARVLVLDDGETRIAIAVADSLMMPRELLDEVKQAAASKTGIAPERMLIAATHTHSAPPVMGALGTDANPDYIEMFRRRLIEAIECAAGRTLPVAIGWSSVDVPELTHCRRWILRPDKVRQDPFGEPTVRANMHPGYQNPEFIGPSGPVDPELSVLAVRSRDGKPVAVLANYSMHYVGGGPGVSPDYYGPFTDKMRRLLGVADDDAGFIAMMSQGTSGDQHWMDYSRPKVDMNTERYAGAIAQRAYEAHRAIEFRDWAPLQMAERTLKLRRRVGDQQRLSWARRIFAEVPGGTPRNQVEVYAREQLLLAEAPERELKLQAVRIGDLGIAAIPNEVFALTGLKIKARSPLTRTFNIELANGAEGYIPPPEQHRLGGYTTWPARTAGLEVEAEPRIVETVLALLEQVSGQPRRALRDPGDAYSRAVLDARPLAYWRGNEMDGASARDATGKRDGRYVGGVALYLDGPPLEPGVVNRAPHFAGGRLEAAPAGLGPDYSVAMWVHNGLPADARAVAGCLFSRGADRLCVGGTAGATAKLYFASGDRIVEGASAIPVGTWTFVALTRGPSEAAIFVNGRPEASGAAPSPNVSGVVVAGDSPIPDSSFEGKLDEIAVFNRRLTPEEVARLYRAAAPLTAGSRAARGTN
ncbi:MAG: hypothetical protein KIT09_09660 [Bryobacteraceae bacterium]|nr:hypothetical protein [Bryobacteraceae bacterium]